MSITIKQILNKINEPRLTLEKFRYDIDPENVKEFGFKRGAYFIWEYKNVGGGYIEFVEYTFALNRMTLDDWVRMGNQFISAIKEENIPPGYWGRYEPGFTRESSFDPLVDPERDYTKPLPKLKLKIRN